MQTFVFVPLAHNIDNGEINENAKARCTACLWRAWEANRVAERQVVLAFGAGAIPGQGTKTLAEYTEEFFLRNRADLPMWVNRNDSKVFGTLEEIRWVVTHARQSYENPLFVIVSQARHIRRVKIIHRWFFPEVPMEFVVSGQTEEVPLWHEFFAYGKLVLVLSGLSRFAEVFRRLAARFTNW